MNIPKKPQLAPTPIRLSDEMKNWLREEAEHNHRSLNGEVIARLEASRQAAPKRKKGEGPDRANG